MLPDWERQRLIDGLSGAELEVWERLGFPLSPPMLARLAHWRQTQAKAEKDREAEAQSRRRTLLAEAEQEHRRVLNAASAARRKRGKAPKSRAWQGPQTYKVAHRKAYPPHGAAFRRAVA